MTKRKLGSLCGLTVALSLAVLLSVLSKPVVILASGGSFDITVTTALDEFDTSGVGTGCSLREAIETVNSAAPFGGCTPISSTSALPTILLPSGNYTLTIPNDVFGSNSIGDLDVRASLIISATGAATPRVAAGAGFNNRIIHVHLGSVTIKRMFISGGSATGNGGGALVDANASLAMSNVTFSGNSATGNGGGAYIAGTAALTGIQFLGNTTGNVSSGDGGGAYIMGAAVLTGTQFLSNTAGHNGGGLYGGGALTLTGGLFQNNYAYAEGGGLFANDMLALIATQFHDNTARFGAGGGAWVIGAATLTGALFRHNYSSVYGGGLAGGTTVTLSDTQFISNTADAAGGGAYIGGDLVTLNRGLFQNNFANSGGGLFANYSLLLTGTQFLSNTAVTGGGGAIAQFATLSGGLFQQNSVTNGDGGGMRAAPALLVTGTQFLSNTASGNGGGLYAGGALTLTGGLFQHNSASMSGGGVWVNNTLALSGTQFLSNTASRNGGGLYAGGALTLTGGLFQHNSASMYGGGVWVNNTLALTGTQFINNTAADGSGLQLITGTSRIVNALFAGNVAAADGAALSFPPLLLPFAVVPILPSASVAILHTTIAGDGPSLGAAISSYSGTLGITDTIIASYTVGINNTQLSDYENYNLFFGNSTNKLGTIGGANDVIGGNPNFVNPAQYNCRLGPGSAAIDTGVNVGVTTDFDGDARPQGSGFDIGYDEALQADLSIGKTDGLTTTLAGRTIIYTVVVTNNSSIVVAGATVNDVVPVVLSAVTWTCIASGGSSCTASGSGNIADSITLAPGGTATYLVHGTISPSFMGTLNNTATVTPPAGIIDPVPANNSATDTTSVLSALYLPLIKR